MFKYICVPKMGKSHSSESTVLTPKSKALHNSKYRRHYTLCSLLKGHNMVTCEHTEVHLHAFASPAPEEGG